MKGCVLMNTGFIIILIDILILIGFEIFKRIFNPKRVKYSNKFYNIEKIIYISILIFMFLGICILFLTTTNNNSNCCTCLDCPKCDVCCDCNNPYLNN